MATTIPVPTQQVGTKTVPVDTGVTVTTLAEVVENPHKRIAVIGEGGSGKTWLAATAPNPAFIDTDYNIQTLRQESFKVYAKRHGVEIDPTKLRVVQVKDPTNPKTGLFTRAEGMWKIFDALNIFNDDPNVETIVFDTLTTLKVMAMHVGLELTGNDGRSETLKEAKQDKNKVPLLTQADFGAEMNVIEQLMNQLPDIKKRIIMNCHIKQEKNKQGGIVAYMPLITGDQHRQQFGSWFNEVWWLDVRGQGVNRKRYIVTQQDAVRKHLKTTMDLPAEIEDPSFPKIMKMAKGL